MTNDLVSVIIPTYKRISKLKNCIESVKKSTYKNIEIIVVNDDPDMYIPKELFKGIKIIQNKRNMYASYSKNLGAKFSKGKFLFFLDDDNILDKNAITNLVRVYNKSIGVLGPIMYNKNKTVWFSGAKMKWIRFNPSKIKSNSNKLLIKTDVIPNAAFISSYLFNRVKGYDKNFPIHGEDLDLPQKLLKLGFQSFIYKKAITIHDYGKLEEHLTPKRLYFVVRAAILLEKKYAKFYKKILFSIYLIIHISYYFIIFIPKRKNKIGYYKNYLKGLKDGILTGI